MDKGYMLICCVEGILDAIQFDDYTEAHCEMLTQLQDCAELSDNDISEESVRTGSYGYDEWSAYYYDTYDALWKIIPVM